MIIQSLSTTIPVESQIKWFSPQKTSGASQQNWIAAFSKTTGVDEDVFSKLEQTTQNK